MKYQVRSTYRGKVRESDTGLTQAQANNLAAEWLRQGKVKTLVILRDSEGSDHPDNAGKYFLDRIWK